MTYLEFPVLRKLNRGWSYKLKPKQHATSIIITVFGSHPFFTVTTKTRGAER